MRKATADRVALDTAVCVCVGGERGGNNESACWSAVHRGESCNSKPRAALVFSESAYRVLHRGATRVQEPKKQREGREVRSLSDAQEALDGAVDKGLNGKAGRVDFACQCKDPHGAQGFEEVVAALRLGAVVAEAVELVHEELEEVLKCVCAGSLVAM